MACEHFNHNRQESSIFVADDGSVSCSECGVRWVQESKLGDCQWQLDRSKELTTLQTIEIAVLNKMNLAVIAERDDLRKQWGMIERDNAPNGA